MRIDDSAEYVYLIFEKSRGNVHWTKNENTACLAATTGHIVFSKKIKELDTRFFEMHKEW